MKTTERGHITGIARMRFVLVMLVVMIHMHGMGIVSSGKGGVYEWMDWMFSRGLTIVAVPGLFTISGYLFFANMERFDWNVFVGKWRRRVGTLLVPYLIWNVAKICFMMLIAFRAGGLNGVFDMFAANGGWRILWDGAEPIQNPAMMVTWYLRDLMVMSLLAPLIYVLVKRLHAVLWVVLVVCGMMEWWPTEHVCNAYNLSFFVMGATMALWGVKVGFGTSKRVNGKMLNGVLIFAAVILFTVNQMIDFYLFNYLTIIVMLMAVYVMAERADFVSKEVTDASTFVYLAHGFLYLTAVGYTIKTILPFDGEIWSCIRFWLIYCATVSSLITLFLLLKNRVPALLKALTGR